MPNLNQIYLTHHSIPTFLLPYKHIKGDRYPYHAYTSIKSDSYSVNDFYPLIINGVTITINYDPVYEQLEYDSPFGKLTSSFNPKQFTTSQLQSKIDKFLATVSEQKSLASKPFAIEPVSEFSTSYSSPFSTIEGSIDEKYMQVSGTISELTKQINTDNILSDMKSSLEAFESTRELLDKLNNTKQSKGLFGTGLFASKSITNDESVQDNIDYMFGIINDRYEKLLTTGSTLQNSRSLILDQIKQMESLETESDQYVSSFNTDLDVPLHDIATNNKIKASIKKYHIKLAKIEGTLLSLRTTIIELSRDLPSLKADLIDDAALGTVLSGVTTFQQMYSAASSLVSDTIKTNTEKIHSTISDLMDIQINNTASIDYLKHSSKASKQFTAMLADKTNLLQTKIISDRNTISQLQLKA